MSFWLLVWWSLGSFGRYGQGTFTWACSFLLDSSAKRFSLGGSHFLDFFGGTFWGTHGDPKISGARWSMRKPHGNWGTTGHPSFCSLQLGGVGRDAFGSPPPESSVASAVPHSSPSAGPPGEIQTKSTPKKPRENIETKCWKKNDQPIFNGSQLSMFFFSYLVFFCQWHLTGRIICWRRCRERLEELPQRRTPAAAKLEIQVGSPNKHNGPTQVYSL